MIVAIGMPVVTMATATTTFDGCVVRRMSAAAMFVVTIVRMESQDRHISAHMAVQALRRRPGELERNKEHQHDGKDTAHGRRLYPNILKFQFPWFEGRESGLRRLPGDGSVFRDDVDSPSSASRIDPVLKGRSTVADTTQSDHLRFL